MNQFAATVAIDWSGAKGKRHKGIAIAEARGDGPPRLVRPDHVWSRAQVLDWLVERQLRLWQGVNDYINRRRIAEHREMA